MQISLDVVNKRSLEESLDFYCQGELMEGDNQYFCEEAGRKVGPAVVIVWQTALRVSCIWLGQTLEVHADLRDAFAVAGTVMLLLGKLFPDI